MIHSPYKAFLLFLCIFCLATTRNLAAEKEASCNFSSDDNDFVSQPPSINESSTKRYSIIEGIHVLVLEGTHYEMGIAYGELLKQALHETRDILKNHFVDEFGLTVESVYTKAMQFHERYSSAYEPFLQGMAQGANLSFEECVMLNGMETLNSLKREKEIAHCAFITIPPERTVAASNLLGRNYDFPAPYEKCAKHTVVTILKEANKATTAIIGMAGQIYCPTCINEAGLFLELNNGMPSGGYKVNYTRQSLLIRLLEILQNSRNMNQLKRQLISTLPDYSLIINAADNDETISVEFSSTLGHQVYVPSAENFFVSTNYFQSTEWNDIPAPTDASTWVGVTRRENLLNLAKNLPDRVDVSHLIGIMNKDISEGGARWNLTIYQLVFDTSDFSLYISRPEFNRNHWVSINLKSFFEA